LSLAQGIHSSVADAAMVNRLREVKEAPRTVYLCKNIKVPCVLIECGFITNSADTALLSSAEYRRNLAYAIFDGVKGYLDQNNSSVVE
jgi:N-acetylmuramoyl-L-alanine amidase